MGSLDLPSEPYQGLQNSSLPCPLYARDPKGPDAECDRERERESKKGGRKKSLMTAARKV